MPPVPTLIRRLALVLGLLISLSALALALFAALLPVFMPGERPAWMLAGFESVCLVTGILMVFFGRGRFSDGPGLALGTLAGTLIIASGFGWISAGRNLGGYSLTPVLALRLVAGVLVAAAGAYCILSRDARSWRVFAIGAACGSPCAAVLGSALVPGGRRVLMNFVTGGGFVQTGLAIVVLVVLGVLLSASVHMIIKAFEMGRVDGPRDRCPRCGYDWKGLPACPECGQPGPAVKSAA